PPNRGPRGAPALPAPPAIQLGPPAPPAPPAIQLGRPAPPARQAPLQPLVPAEARAPRLAGSTILAPPERAESDRSERSDRRPDERGARRPRWRISRQGKPEAEPLSWEGQPRRLFRRNAGAGAATAGTGDLVARLDLAARGMREAAVILRDMPFFADPGIVASALVAEITERFSAKTVALYVPDASGRFEVLAGRGLSGAEQRMSVPADHPLLAEVAGRFGALLIAPVEMAQGLVAGIGGSRTPALMASPLPVGGVCEGVAIVGVDEATDDDLDALVSLTAEAAPGVAITRWLGRLIQPRPSGAASG
ncbi:MAG: hypothetical protein ACRDJ4_05615, partial [Actinomycetota bacterium]